MGAIWPRLPTRNRPVVSKKGSDMATSKMPKKVASVVVGEEPAKETMRKANVNVANTRSQDYPPMKTSGIKIRGTGCATKGVMARGPMA